VAYTYIGEVVVTSLRGYSPEAGTFAIINRKRKNLAPANSCIRGYGLWTGCCLVGTEGAVRLLPRKFLRQPLKAADKTGVGTFLGGDCLLCCYGLLLPGGPTLRFAPLQSVSCRRRSNIMDFDCFSAKGMKDGNN
jgi:hypothetical protein